jgi:hypothetical protein
MILSYFCILTIVIFSRKVCASNIDIMEQYVFWFLIKYRGRHWKGILFPYGHFLTLKDKRPFSLQFFQEHHGISVLKMYQVWHHSCFLKFVLILIFCLPFQCCPLPFRKQSSQSTVLKAKTSTHLASTMEELTVPKNNDVLEPLWTNQSLNSLFMTYLELKACLHVWFHIRLVHFILEQLLFLR